MRAALRADGPLPADATEAAIVGDIGTHTDWTRALAGVDCVVHCAARAHRLGDREEAPYLEVNAFGTERLVRASVRAAVRRFVLLSSIKVNGEGERGSAPLRGDDAPAPEGAYARSKWLAEQAMLEAGAQSTLETVIVRAPLIYGPQVRGNFLRLLHLVDRELPLPFGCIRNRRSLVSVWNLCDLIVRSLGDGVPRNRTYLVCDGEDLSTPELVRRLGALLERRVRLLSVPVGLLRAGGALAGRRAEVERLCDSLRVDAKPARRELAWQPPVSVDEGLRRTAFWYRAASGPA